MQLNPQLLRQHRRDAWPPVAHTKLIDHVHVRNRHDSWQSVALGCPTRGKPSALSPAHRGCQINDC
jgi:hypothetical protein